MPAAALMPPVPGFHFHGAGVKWSNAFSRTNRSHFGMQRFGTPAWQIL
jgi:hypothetical protein